MQKLTELFDVLTDEIFPKRLGFSASYMANQQLQNIIYGIVSYPLSPGILKRLTYSWLYPGEAGAGQPFSLKKAQNVLIIRLDDMGDMVLTTPFIREIRHNLNERATLSILLKPESLPLLKNCPYVDQIFTFNCKGRKLLSPYVRNIRALKLARKLWKHNFDLAIIPRFGPDLYHAKILAYYSKAKWRVGYSETGYNKYHDNFKNDLDKLLTERFILTSQNLHEVKRSLELIHLMGGTVKNDRLEIWLDNEDELAAEQIFQQLDSGKKVIAIAPGAGHPKRIWPRERYLEIAKWLVDNMGCQVLLVGQCNERYLGDYICNHLSSSVFNFIGETSLGQTAALLRNCHLYIGNDSGPMHIAAAVGTPVIEISCHPQKGDSEHPNSPLRFGPWGVRHTVLQPYSANPPCANSCEANSQHCIKNVFVKDLKDEISNYIRPSLDSFKQ